MKTENCKCINCIPPTKEEDFKIKRMCERISIFANSLLEEDKVCASIAIDAFCDYIKKIKDEQTKDFIQAIIEKQHCDNIQ